MFVCMWCTCECECVRVVQSFHVYLSITHTHIHTHTHTFVLSSPVLFMPGVFMFCCFWLNFCRVCFVGSVYFVICLVCFAVFIFAVYIFSLMVLMDSDGQ